MWSAESGGDSHLVVGHEPAAGETPQPGGRCLALLPIPIPKQPFPCFTVCVYCADHPGHYRRTCPPSKLFPLVYFSTVVSMAAARNLRGSISGFWCHSHNGQSSAKAKLAPSHCTRKRTIGCFWAAMTNHDVKCLLVTHRRLLFVDSPAKIVSLDSVFNMLTMLFDSFPLLSLLFSITINCLNFVFRLRYYSKLP